MRLRAAVWLLLAAPVSSQGQERPIERREQSEAALVGIVDRLLNRRASFEEYVAAESLLVGPNAAQFQRSGVLQYRRLLLVRNAESARYSRQGLRGPALGDAWLQAHGDFLADDPFSDAWYPRADPYWRLYDAHKRELWADDLAWDAAQLRPPADECYSDCVLELFVIKGPLEYWTRLPEGRHVDDALRVAGRDVEYAVGVACYDAERPVPREYRLIQQIRQSLSAVSSELAKPLLAQLDRIETACRAKERP